MNKCKIERFKEAKKKEAEAKEIKEEIIQLKERILEIAEKHEINFKNDCSTQIEVMSNSIIIKTCLKVSFEFLDEIKKELYIERVGLKIGGIVTGLIPVTNNWLEMEFIW